MIDTYVLGDTITVPFNTFRFSTGAPFTLAGTPRVQVRRVSDGTLVMNDLTPTVDANSITGRHRVAIDTSVTDEIAYAADEIYEVLIQAGTVDSVSVVGTILAQFALVADEGLTGAQIQDIEDLLDEARAEPAQGAPAVNASMRTKVDYIYQWLRNKVEQTATERRFFADDATTINQKQSLSDAAGTLTTGEMATGA